jgi:hypothetical protein
LSLAASPKRRYPHPSSADKFSVFKRLAGWSVTKVLSQKDLAAESSPEKKVLREAQAKGFDGLYIRGNLYLLAFRRGDSKGMEQQLAWAAGRAGDEDAMLSGHADTDAYYGRLVRAADYSRPAVESAVRADSKETAALWQVTAGLR